MIDATLLFPPGYGPRANPILFGVSEGLARFLPLPDSDAVWPAAPEGEGKPAQADSVEAAAPGAGAACSA